MFLQASHIPSTFANISHTPTQLKESSHITLPTRISKENNDTSCTQTMQPVLGFTPAEIHHAQNELTLTVPQLLEIESCKDYAKTPLQTLDGLYVTQPKRFICDPTKKIPTPCTRGKKISGGILERRNHILMGWT